MQGGGVNYVHFVTGKRSGTSRTQRVFAQLSDLVLGTGLILNGAKYEEKGFG